MRPPSLPALRVLGPVAVRNGGRWTAVPARLDRGLLVHLVLAEGRALSVELLVDALWGEHPPPRSRNALQVKVSRLRKALGDLGGGLLHTQGTYRLVVDDDAVDVRVFSQRVREAATLVAHGRLELARSTVEQVMELWQPDPWRELDDHPRLVAARRRLAEEWATAQELHAETGLGSEPGLRDAILRTREVLDHDPLRPRARLLLMEALERSGLRAEALAVYDAGRRVFAEQTGLAPPVALQEAFRGLLDVERRAVRGSVAVDAPRAAPPGALETAQWLATQGDLAAAAGLALRGSWWWWFGGRRSAGRDLFEDLVDHEATTRLDPQQVLRLSAWLAVFQAVEASAEAALQAGERALDAARRGGWSHHEALAAVLLAERLFQRGDHGRAGALLLAGRAQFRQDGDEWGLALTEVVEAKATLLAGGVATARRVAHRLVRMFEELGDPAGQVMALDLAGYCAEISGDLVASSSIHRRGLDLARRVGAPEWEAAQLTRLGSVLALSGGADALSALQDAGDLAESIGSGASLALADNGLGLAATLTGDTERATRAHARALAWYERQESPAGVSYSAGRLAVGLAATDRQTAAEQARRATTLARRTGDPRAVAHGYEAVASVVPDPVEGARALGAARALRSATAAPLPAVLAAALVETERALHRQLGDALVDELRRGATGARRITAVLP